MVEQVAETTSAKKVRQVYAQVVDGNEAEMVVEEKVPPKKVQKNTKKDVENVVDENVPPKNVLPKKAKKEAKRVANKKVVDKKNAVGKQGAKELKMDRKCVGSRAYKAT